MEKRRSCEFRDEQREIELKAKQMGKMLANLYASSAELAGQIVDRHEHEEIVHGYVEHAVSRYHHDRAEKELEQYHVWWDAITAEHVIALKQALQNAKNEEDMQKFLTDNKIFLIQHLCGGHGRYVLPKPKLGAELIPDFLLAELSSIGIEWHAVELESPLAKMFTSSGQPSHLLTRAVQQVINLRHWLLNNIAYARSPKFEGGLGLVGIDANLPATILIGRRETVIPPKFNAYRREMKQRLSIEIHSYDWLIEQAEERVHLLQESRKQISNK